jgi:hypothetical protein
MSVSIATMGKFNQCCGGGIVGGGAPPYRQNEQIVKPHILVKNVEMETINEQLLQNLTVKLIEDE